MDDNSSESSLDKNLQLNNEYISETGDKKPIHTNKLTIAQTSLAFIAGTTGLGLAGMPYSLYHLGLYLFLFASCFIGTISHLSNLLCLRVKDLTPSKLESMYEIAYLLFGRSSIFIVCIVIFLSNFGSLIAFYIVFGDILSSLFTQVLLPPSENMGEQLSNHSWLVQ